LLLLAAIPTGYLALQTGPSSDLNGLGDSNSTLPSAKQVQNRRVQSPDRQSSASPHESVAEAGTKFSSWRVTCRLPDSSLAKGLAVSANAGFRHIRDWVATTYEVRTDNNGVAVFHFPLEPSSLSIGVETQEWFSPRRLTAKDFSWDKLTGNGDAELAVLPVVRVYVDVRYSDDTPFEGPLNLSQNGWQHSVLVSQGRCEVANLPLNSTLFIVKPLKPGFTMLFRTIGVEEIIPNGRIELVLGTSKWPRCGLVVNVPNIQDVDLALHLHLRLTNCEESRLVVDSQMKTLLNKAEPWEGHFENFELKPGTYEISVVAGRYVAQRSVLISEGEVATVALNLEEGAQVKVFVVDSDGKPIQGAILRRAGGPYIAFPAPMLRSDQRQTDINGEANLFGVAPSEQEFQVEAAGFEVFKFALTPIARTTTVQRCVLAEASGKIVVTLKGQASGKYLISYCHPTEGTGGHLQDLHLSDRAALLGFC
jgi:hypothetical protein